MKVSKEFTGIVIVFVFAFILAGCQDEDRIGEKPVENYSFRLVLPHDLPVPGKIATRAQEPDAYTVRYFLADEEGNVVNKKFTAYDREKQRITVEPLVSGKYELFVLAYSPLLEQEGFTVASSLAHKSDPWIRFTKAASGLIKNRSILFGKSPFEIRNQSTFNGEILLAHVFSSVSFDPQASNEYVVNTVRTVSVSSQGGSVFSSLSVDGVLSGEVPLEVSNLPVSPGIPVYTFPGIGNEVTVPFTVRVETRNYEGMDYASVFEDATVLKRAQHSTVNLSLDKHPDAKNGMLYVRSGMYSPDDCPRILQDDEPSSVFYDPSQRSFHINEPLQVRLTEDQQLHTRFYCPIALSNVKVWAKHPDLSEDILIAFIDTVPAFSDAKYNLLPKAGQVFGTRNGNDVKLSERQASRLKLSAFSVESDDLFWKKIRAIKSKWYIKWDSFGGNPDIPSGGPVGNWMGIRPVHIRESIAIWLNVGYMITLPDFKDRVLSYQGRLYGNGGIGDWLDTKLIIPHITNLSGFNIGLTYGGHGVIGLGGGRTWGIWQYGFLNHYDGSYSCTVMFHELGHCLGYSHSSNMTYGLWSEELANSFYVKNVDRFPVNNKNFLNSRNNTHLY